MANELLDVQFDDNARVQFDTLGPESRRIVNNCLEDLRHWRDYEPIRQRSKRLATGQDKYLTDTGLGYVLFIEISGDRAAVQGIYRKEALQRA